MHEVSSRHGLTDAALKDIERINSLHHETMRSIHSGDKTADLAHVENDVAEQLREIRKQHRTAMSEIMLKHKLSKVQAGAVNRWQDNILRHSDKVMVSASQLRAQKKNLHHVHVHHHVQLYADHVKMLNEMR